MKIKTEIKTEQEIKVVTDIGEIYDYIPVIIDKKLSKQKNILKRYGGLDKFYENT